MQSVGSLEVIFTSRIEQNRTEQNTTNPEDRTNVYEAVRWIQLVMALLSVLGSGSIMVSSASQSRIRTPELQPLVLLSASDLLLALSWLVGAALFSQGCGRHTCYHLHTAEQVLYMASFFYTLNYVWSLYTGIRRTFDSSINGNPVQVKDWSLYDHCLLPVFLMSPTFVPGNVGHCYANVSHSYNCLLMHTGALYLPSEHRAEQCSLLHTYRIAVFLTTFLFTLTGIVVLMAKTRHIHRRVVTSSGYLGDRQWASLRVVEIRMFLYPSVFIFCWGPAVYLAAVRLAKPTAVQGLEGVVLYIIQAFTSASQGFFNCLVYGWTHRHFRSATRKALSRDADTQTPLLRSQKRHYQTLRTAG
ncbi:transmembrane protein 116 [Polymixia lowei]